MRTNPCILILTVDCLVAGHEHPEAETCLYCLETDTTWVLCCGSAARGLTTQAIIDISDWIVKIAPDTLLPYNNRFDFPERWYIESVDTTKPDFIHFCDVMGCECWKEQIKVCTTWAKKIPLSEVRLTLEEIERLMKFLQLAPDDK